MKQNLRNVMIIAAILMIGSSAIAATGEITSDFNNTAIAEGDYIWFSSSAQLMGVGNHPAKVYVRNAGIIFEADGLSYLISVPDSTVTFTPGQGMATASYNNGVWEVKAEPCCSSGNTFLSGVAFHVPEGGFTGGIKNVRWVSDYLSDTPGLKLAGSGQRQYIVISAMITPLLA